MVDTSPQRHRGSDDTRYPSDPDQPGSQAFSRNRRRGTTCGMTEAVKIGRKRRKVNNCIECITELLILSYCQLFKTQLY